MLSDEAACWSSWVCSSTRRDPRRGLIDIVQNLAGCEYGRVHRTDPVVGGVTGLRAVICAVAGFRHDMVWRSKPLVHLGARVPTREKHMCAGRNMWSNSVCVCPTGKRQMVTSTTHQTFTTILCTATIADNTYSGEGNLCRQNANNTLEPLKD